MWCLLGIELEGQKDVLGQWVSQGSEDANFWLSILTDLQTHGVEDFFIACVDGLKGFKEVPQSVFPQTAVQKCVVHQIRNSLKYIPWEDRKAFVNDLKKIYKAPTREADETRLLNLAET